LDITDIILQRIWCKRKVIWDIVLCW